MSDALWMGPSIHGSKALVNAPSDVPYKYQRVEQAKVDFDPSRLRRIILARHGETLSNRWGIFQGSADGATISQGLVDALAGQSFPYAEGDTISFDLNANGLADANALAEALASRIDQEQVAGLFSSPLRRAQQTALPLATLWQREIERLDALREASAPTWEGLHGDKQIAGQDPAHALWLANPYENAPPGGESAEELIERAEQALQTLVEATPEGKTSIGFTHKGFLLWVLERYLGSRAGVEDSALAAPVGQTSEHWKVSIPNGSWATLYVFGGRVVLPDDGHGNIVFPGLSTANDSDGPTATGDTL